MQVRTVIEIVLLAVVYYFILNSIRGTRGYGILKGLIFFVVLAFFGATFIARQLELRVIEQVLKTLLGASSIAAIVIFAPELRRFLLRLSRSQVFSVVFRGAPNKIVGELVTAATRLAVRRDGASLDFRHGREFTLDRAGAGSFRDMRGEALLVGTAGLAAAALADHGRLDGEVVILVGGLGADAGALGRAAGMHAGETAPVITLPEFYYGFLGVAVAFQKARRGTSDRHALVETARALVGCGAVAAIAYVIASWVGLQLLP